MSEKTGQPKTINDPDKYERMAAPYESQTDANAAMAKFLDGVAKLREECRVPEVLVMVATYFKPDGKSRGMGMQTSAHGSGVVAAELGAYAYRHHTLPWVDRAKALKAIAGDED